MHKLCHCHLQCCKERTSSNGLQKSFVSHGCIRSDQLIYHHHQMLVSLVYCSMVGACKLVTEGDCQKGGGVGSFAWSSLGDVRASSSFPIREFSLSSVRLRNPSNVSNFVAITASQTRHDNDDDGTLLHHLTAISATANHQRRTFQSIVISSILVVVILLDFGSKKTQSSK